MRVRRLLISEWYCMLDNLSGGAFVKHMIFFVSFLDEWISSDNQNLGIVCPMDE